MSAVLDGAARTLLHVGRAGARPAGAVVGVLDASGVRLGAAGWALLPAGGAPGVRMTPGTRFDLASVTKVLCTTAAVARLVATGRLDLDAPAAEHLPDAPALRDGVSTADLLSHRAGLAPWFPLYCRATEREAALDLAGRLPAAHAPRTATLYSDLGFVLLGRLVERVTGLPLAEALADLVSRPLRLRRTGFGAADGSSAAASSDDDHVERAMVADGDPYPVDARVDEFDGWRTTVVRGVPADGNAAHALGGASGHAGLFAPVDEVLVVASALAQGPFLPDDVRHRFVTAGADPGQALGLRRTALPGVLAGQERPVPAVGHSGFTGTWFAAALDRPLVVALAATRLHGVAVDRRHLTPVEDLADAATSALVPAGARP